MLKRGGVIECSRNFLGGSSKCSCPFTRGEGGVKKVQNLVHVVCEWPQTGIFFSKNVDFSLIDVIVQPFLFTIFSIFGPLWASKAIQAEGVGGLLNLSKFFIHAVAIKNMQQ